MGTYDKEYYEQTKEKYKDKRNATTKKWLKENRDKWNEYQRSYREKKREVN